MALWKAVAGAVWLAAGSGIVLLLMGSLGFLGCDSAGRSPHAEPASAHGQSAGETAEIAVPEVAVGELAEGLLGQSVKVEGEVTKQCPAIGCWFLVKDRTGEVFVDLNPAGLRLTEKREGQHAEVTGRVVKQGGQFRLEAQSVQFGSNQRSAEQNPESKQE